ncbi:DUF2381 family protein [Myxococcus vastator]|uniref:DUF2381 family protein n=1 Tax=Myxococcus vastator TaxID=2709664 RepID=UPI0013D43D41|nr:DUF2381 family protein [Myxococcus vastator]
MPRLVAILYLLVGFAAPAQSLTAPRERVERRVILSGNPSEPVPEIRIAAGTTTLLRFDARLDRGTVEVEGRERLQFVDAGERVLVLEPMMDLGSGERLLLRVRYADDAAPAQGVFALVSSASEVDVRVDVFRRRDSIEVLRAELADARARLVAKEAELGSLHARCQASGPAGLVLAGLLDERGVAGHPLVRVLATKPGLGLVYEKGMALHAEAWSVVFLRVRNTGAEQWAATTAELVSLSSGERVEVVAVRMQQPVIAPGDTGHVVIEVKNPPASAGAAFHLEVGDGAGRGRTLALRVMLGGTSK